MESQSPNAATVGEEPTPTPCLQREREKGPIQGEGPDQMHAPAACWDLSYPAATPQQIKSTTKTTNKGANRKEIREETTTT